MDDNSLNDIQSKIKQAKSKEELSKNWAAYMEELKKKAARASGPNSAPEALRSGAREANKANELTSPVSLTPMEAAREKIRKLETELSQTQKEKDDAGRQIKEISEKLRLQDSQISSQEEELRQRALEVQKVKEELNQKALDLAKNEEQIARLRQDFAARVMEIERLRQERDSFMEMEQGIRQKSQMIRETETRYNESLAKTQELLARLEEKDREIEQLRYQLERAVSGENQRLMNERIGALTARAAELETGLAAKEKELEDFKSYLSEQQSQTARQREEEAGESARQKLLLEEKIEQANIRLRQLEEESASLRRILVKEDERARQLEISCHGLEDERRALKGRLEILTGDVREHQGKLSRFLETAEAVPAKRSAEDEARRMPGAQDELYGAAFLADAAGPATEPYEWDEPLLGLEGRVGLDDQLFGDLPPETGEEK